VCSLPTNRSKFGSIAINQQVYLFGGKKGKERVNDSEIYNITTNKWARFEPMNKNRSGFAIVHIGHLLYFIGGNDGESILSTV
jgi:N-acetylneuraminic acid mutarotase